MSVETTFGSRFGREKWSYLMKMIEHSRMRSPLSSCAIGSDAFNLHENFKAVPARGGLTGWSSRRLQAPLVGTLRATHSGAAYRER